ncbi:magnesium transporter NIPA-domain-containing protein [Cladorrhinum samala]|uniref:Magnesium transporter NIPA-domain-containing protein n=1 Tax=Cladorrhinum samala TaxID=585594 RepID=A0AAV9H8S0_9PEZI|nr:magnesium transporter NIPA-domain-containing protein [Cladorrhinum samala]
MHLPPTHAAAVLSERSWPSWLPQFPFSGHGNGTSPGGGGEGGDDELQNWSSLIGIVTAICGNVLIALALNVQRYAHIRLHRHKAAARERAKQALKNATQQQRQQQGQSVGGYGAVDTSNGVVARTHREEDGNDEEEEEAHETDPLTQSFQSDDSRWTLGSDSDENSPKVASSYLQDPYWWLGQVLITVGEMGNFLAYGFAPASIVSPLGVVALVSNCVIAPIFFKEVFRQRDFWGVIIAIGGAVTVVLSAKTEETKLGPHDVWDAITTMEFEIYMGVSIALIALLMYLSPRYGNRTILIDLGLVGLFGGYTALSTKGVSSMLSSTLLGAFTTPVTYVLLLILISTAIMQVRFLNKALQRFDSTQVIPIQFVLFTLSVIIGSAVLYRDFERTTREQAIKFVGGCLLTFFGVFLITSGRPPHDDEEEDTLSDAEGIEETINLSNQDRNTEPAPPARTVPQRSRRSSKVSFKEGGPTPIIQKHDFLITTTTTTTNTTNTATQENGSRNNNHELPPPNPRTFFSQTISSDSVPSTVISETSTLRRYTVTGSTPELTPGTPSQPPPLNLVTTGVAVVNRPTTPAAPRALTHLTGGGPVISPSPFSSTLTAVVADTFLSHLDSITGVSPTNVRSRPGLRNSLFAPAQDLADSAERGAVEGEQGTRREGGGGYLRGRARSLSHTLGELFGVSRPAAGLGGQQNQEGGEEDERAGNGSRLERARTAAGASRSEERL